MSDLPETIAALAMFGLVVVLPLVAVLLRHQRAMAEIIHRNAGDTTQQRLSMLEQELRELRALRHEQIIREDDQRELSRRMQ